MKAYGMKKSVLLRKHGSCHSTYYAWLKKQKCSVKRPSVLKLTEVERQTVIDKKRKHPHLSHRQISSYLRYGGYLVSESSCYRILKALGWIFPQSLREAPWKKPHLTRYGERIGLC